MIHGRNTPLIWLPFAAGGTLAAFLAPIMAFLSGVAFPLDFLAPGVFLFDSVSQFLHAPLGILLVFTGIFTGLWHGVHRLRLLIKDFGICRAGHSARIADILCYGTGFVGSAGLTGALIWEMI